MAKEIDKIQTSVFKQIRHIDESGDEYWMARQLSKVFDYTDFRNFAGVIEKRGIPVKTVGMIRKTISLKPTRW